MIFFLQAPMLNGIDFAANVDTVCDRDTKLHVVF